MHFDDLSHYSYYQPRPFTDVFNVGWIGETHEFSKGYVTADFLDKLKKIMRRDGGFNAEVNKIRSIHSCNICGLQHFASLNAVNEIQQGSAEIWIPKLGGGFFSAPSMLLHYVADHDYLPPAIFVESVLALDVDEHFNSQEEYRKRAAMVMEN